MPRELKPIIYCQAIKYGGVDEWDFLWERYQRSNVGSEKAKLLSALGCSSETWLLNRYWYRLCVIQTAQLLKIIFNLDIWIGHLIILLFASKTLLQYSIPWLAVTLDIMWLKTFCIVKLLIYLISELLWNIFMLMSLFIMQLEWTNENKFKVHNYYFNFNIFSYQPRGDRVGRYVKVIGSQMKTKEELDEVINRTCYFLKN